MNTTPEQRNAETRLQSFKVNELQMILQHFKVQKIGKKHELLVRCLELLRNPAHTRLVIDKVREVDTRANQRATPYPLPTMSNGAAASAYAQQQQGMYRAGMPGGYGMGGCAVYGMQQQYAGSMANVSAAAHQQSMTPRPARNLTPMTLPFYDPLCTLLEPHELPASPNGVKTNAQVTLTFNLSQNDYSKLQTNAHGFPRTEIQLRFFNATGDILNIEQPDDFPLNCSVKLNESPVTLPNVIPTNKPNVEPKRPSRPVNITQYATSLPAGRQHRMKIDWAADKRTWAVAIYLVTRVDATILRQRVQDSPSFELPYETTEATIRKRLGGGDDDDVAMDSLKISLLCPLGKTRMKIAARSRDCTHIQCFDLDLYLQMNEKRPTWKCCVCSGSAPYHKLIIDKYFMRMLSELSSSVTDVELLKDGQWRVVKEDDICDISDDDDDDVKPRAAAAAAAAAPAVKGEAASSSAGGGGAGTSAAAAAAAAAANNDIITISDDDEEDTDLRNAIRASMPSSASSVDPPSLSSMRTPIKSSSTTSPSSDDSIIVLDDTPPRPTPAAAAARPAVPTSSAAAAPSSSNAAAAARSTATSSAAANIPLPPSSSSSSASRPYVSPPGIGSYNARDLRDVLNQAAAQAPQSAPPMMNQQWANQQYLQHMQQQQQQYAGFYGMQQQPQYGNGGYSNNGQWLPPNANAAPGGYGNNGVIRRPDDGSR